MIIMEIGIVDWPYRLDGGAGAVDSYPLKYITTSPIYIKGNSQMVDFAERYAIPGDGSSANPYIISYFKIDAKNTAVPIYIGSVTYHLIVRNNVVYNYTAGDGIKLENINGVAKVENNQIWNVKYGITLLGGSDIVLKNNTIREVVHYGININKNPGNVLYENKLYNATILLINSRSTFTDEVIPENNTMNGLPVKYINNLNENNATLTGNYGEVILGNVSWLKIDRLSVGNRSIGVLAGYSHHVEISNSTFNGDVYGIRLYTVHNFTIENNEMVNTVRDGILMQSESSTVYSYNNTIRNNTIRGSGESGIHQYDFSSHNYVIGNTVENSANDGILAQRVWYNEISNNTVRNNTQNGIQLSYLGIHDITISNNTCYGNSQNGIWIYDYVSNVLVKGNRIEKNHDDGIEVSYHTDNITISQNLFVRNNGYGVRLYGTINTKPVRVYNNSFYYNHGSTDSFSSAHRQGYDDNSGKNIWNTTVGNFWADWARNNDTNDQNPHDDIVDWPYLLDGGAGAKDNKPIKNDPLNSKVLPGAPRSVSAHAGDGFVNITWSEPSEIGSSDILRYNIYRNGTLVAWVSGDVLYYNDTGVSNGNHYTYYITAVNSAGEGYKSASVSATPMTVPSAPLNLVAEAGAGYVNLTWSAPTSDGGSAITEYRIYRNGTLIATVPAEQLWYNDTDVKGGVTYTYYVTAVNSEGESEKSNEVSATPEQAVPELQPYWLIVLFVVAIAALLRRKH